MSNSFGLNNEDLKGILLILESVSEVDEAIIFGSRAKGNFRNGSDVDIAIKGSTVTFSDISHISYCLNEETLMPYKFDVLDYNMINNDELKDHINRIGRTLYKKQNTY